jgi:parallel beta-helix repeat protein
MDLPLRRAVGGILLAIFALASVGLLTIGQETQARGRHIHCGQRITRDTTLHRDLRNCPNKGIVIRADDVTLDLNGHAIDGDGKLVKHCHRHALCDVGVLNDGHDHVTVRHGSVREFGPGVWAVSRAGPARHNHFLDISSSRNDFFGIGLFDCARSTIRDSSVFRNGRQTDIEGISMFRSDHNRIVHNSARRNGDVGLFMAKSDHNQIRKNRMRRNRVGGISVEGDGNEIVRNRVLRGAIQITIFTDNGRAVGNLVRRNHVRDAPGSGISVDPPIKRTLISRNHVRGAGQDGINVLSRSTTLTRNRAVHNDDLGIQAVKGVIDGGGNRASGNGDPRQCVNVTCHQAAFPKRGRALSAAGLRE